MLIHVRGRAEWVGRSTTGNPDPIRDAAAATAETPRRDFHLTIGMCVGA